MGERMNVNEIKLNEWLKSCHDLIVDKYKDDLSNLDIPRLDVKKGSKFYKIIQVDNQRRVWAFVNIETLDIFKPATWAAPAKHARGNINDKSKGLGNLTYLGPDYL